MTNLDGKKTTWESLVSWLSTSFKKFRDWVAEKRAIFTPANVVATAGRFSVCFFGTALYALVPRVRSSIGTSFTDCFNAGTLAERLYKAAGFFFEAPYMRIKGFNITA